MQNVDHAFIKTTGVRLHVAQAGPTDGPLAILLHGFPEAHFEWQRQLPALAAAGFRVLAPDQRGYNLSDKPQEVAAYNLDTLVDDVLGLIEHTAREKAYIVGHDWGGAVAWWLAARYPERVERLVILNVPHPIVLGRALRTSWSQRRRSWYMFYFQLARLPEASLRAGNWRALARTMQRSSVPGTFSEADMKRYRTAWAQPGAATGMVNWYRAMWQARPRRLASVRITVPTLVLWGLRDNVLGAEMIQPSLDLCDDGRLVAFDDATHWVAHEKPDAVNRRLLEFLSA